MAEFHQPGRAAVMMVSVSEFDAKFAEGLKAVEGGETVTICRDGMAIAEIVQPKGTDNRRPRKLGTLAGKIAEIDPDCLRRLRCRR